MGWFKQLMGLEAPKANTESKWTANETLPAIGRWAWHWAKR